MLRNFRKPLVVASPKILLRYPVSQADTHTSCLLVFEVLPPSLGPPPSLPRPSSCPPALLQEAVSSLSDMSPGTSFRYVLPDLSAERDPSKVTQVVLCSGKHYYALDKYRREQERTDVAIVRMEVSCRSLPPCARP